MQILTWQARHAHNLSLVALAKKSGISKSALCNIENGKTSPTLNQLEKIAKALDMRISDLYESDYK